MVDDSSPVVSAYGGDACVVAESSPSCRTALGAVCSDMSSGLWSGEMGTQISPGLVIARCIMQLAVAYCTGISGAMQLLAAY